MPIDLIPSLWAIASTTYKAIVSAASKEALTKAIRYLLSKTQLLLPKTLSGHRKELISSLSRMPFIYKDLTTEVLRDFAEIKFEILDPTTLEVVNDREEGTHVIALSRILNKPKALFIGNAGIGKTTFFRYTVLSLITSLPGSVRFFPEEHLVPFYIPLKIIDNTQPYPILNYILNFYKYAAGPGGFRRLIQLAHQKRLFLLLDGYDEIYLPPSTQANFLMIELNIIFSGKVPSYWLVRTDGQFREFYEGINLCRIWLSSRREFYSIHPLDFSQSGAIKSGKIDLIALSISGLHNRSLLVTKIFNVYRSRNQATYSMLSEESFLQDIDLTGDDDLIDLSFSPLFLTVMCYIHVQGLGRPADSSYADYRRATMSDLILICIDLLLTDLDEERVRDVPPEQRAVFRDVFKKRRSLYPIEKREFLGYFANYLLGANVQVFEEEKVLEMAITFFSTEYREGLADEILRSLTSKNKSEHHFVRQLLNQGVFVLVPKVGERRFYDFPHRRFREVLAARYLNTPERVRQVIENLNNPQYAEFLYVFFSVSHYQNQILDLLLERTGTSEAGQNSGALAVNCLRVRPRYYDATPVLMNWIRSCIINLKPFQIPRQVLDHLFPNREAVTWLVQVLREALENGDKHVFAVAGPILIKHNKTELALLLVNGFDAAIRHKGILPNFFILLAEVDPEQIFARLEPVKGDLELFRGLLIAYSILGSDCGGEKFWRLMHSDLSFDQRVVLADIVQRFNPEIFTRFDQYQELSDELELFVALVRYVRSMSGPSFELAIANKKLDSKKKVAPESIYVVTQSVVSTIGDGVMRKTLRKFMGSVHTSADFLNEIKTDFRIRITESSRRDAALIQRVARVLAQLAASIPPSPPSTRPRKPTNPLSIPSDEEKVAIYFH